ncbi:talin-1-like [Salvelinus namaycush]|uniref:Talin-1-like n=1 Tax=Salvelinus namaycush TaxID=8040 RepID=A0A8U0PL11_SALNM|nr:talin-1-like [Salvelinus namaycush]
MVALSLKIGVGNVVKTMQFEPSTMVYDACRMIRERVPEAQLGQPNDYGLFLSDEDPKKGIWLEAGKALDYYMLRNGDTLEYKKKQRPLKIRMLDGTVKTVMVDDSKIVSDMLMTICARIGITNYDEYSLVHDVVEEKKEEMTGTLTRRDKTLMRDDKKMEKLKQKLHTDDELNWLDHGRTLREQGVEETEMLLLRRKFFYSDQNVDSRDPVQLNLLYVQARDDILNGSHPVSFEKACDFAGYQCQIQFGDHNETKHKPGFLDLKEFLPKEYIKNKGEKRIFQAHKNYQNMTEIEAKVSYVKLARSLKTYGVSFFLVKEKMKGKNKLVPRLLGITKECVMRVDEKTKEVIQEWNLTNIKRWAASPKSFTLDFGDYQDGYYSVQTTEGEQIAQLIAGYIDIILKKKKSKDHFGLEGDEESTMLEDSVSPKKSTVLQQQFNKVGKVETGSVALPAIMRSGAGGPESFQMGSMPQAKQHITSGQMHRGHMPPLTSAQQALTGTINSSMQALQAAQASLEEFDTLPPLGTDAASQAWRKNKMDESKHEIHSQVDAITAGTASMVNLTAGDPAETDYTAVGCAVTTISSNLTEMSKGVKLLAALMEDEGGNGNQLLGAAKNLACAVSDMLKTAQPANTEPRQNLLQAAGNVGQASGELLSHIGETDADPRFQDMLMQLAKAVANAAAALVLKAKNVAQKTEDSALQNRVIAAATQCALSTSQLVACTRVVAPTISSPVCQEQLIEAGKLVAKSVDGCVDASQGATSDEGLLKQVGAAATGVTHALNELLQHIKQYAHGGQPIGRHGEATDRILDVTENIFSSMGDAGEMVRQARILAQATSDLVNAIKMDAEGESDLENSRKLLSAAKLLADATAKMVEAAKGAAANPDSEEQQQRLREAAEGLRMATNAAAQNAIKKRLVNKLENAAKQAAAAATQTIAAAQHAASSNKNPAAQQQLVQSCKVVADQIPQLVQGVRGSQSQPDSPSAQLTLIGAGQNFLLPGAKMVTAAKATVPTIGDQASAMQLSQCAKNLATALAELRTAAQKAQEACGPLEIDNALTVVRGLEKDMVEAKASAGDGKLKPLPGETALHEELAASVQEISNLIEPVAIAARSEASHHGTQGSQMVSYFGAPHNGKPAERPLSCRAWRVHAGYVGFILLDHTAAATQEAFSLGGGGGGGWGVRPDDEGGVDAGRHPVGDAALRAPLRHGCLMCWGPSGWYVAPKSASQRPYCVGHHRRPVDTTIMFATAGTLNRENSETFADHRQPRRWWRTQAAGLWCRGQPGETGPGCQSSVITITNWPDVVKLGAASLGAEDPETQVVLINAVKDVAKALSDLISATKALQARSRRPCHAAAEELCKVMVTNVTSLLKTVKAVEDEATKGTRGLEATIEHIKQELAVFSNGDPPPKTSTPEDFIRMTKGITQATAKAVAAGNSCRQEDVIATANLSRRAIADMLHSCKQAAYHPEVSKEVQSRALRYGNECAVGYLGLLEHVLVIIQKPSHELKQQLANYSKRVAGSVTELIQAAEAMKGTEWVDPEDPTVIAENELLGAAAAIEAAARKLELLRPRTKPKEADESLNFEEQILEAAKSIAAATSALVKAASAAQRELVAQGKVGACPANAVDDGQWSQGLISAARMVAAATSNLCEAANSAVQGHASEEKLVSSAKQVSASTAQLLVACKVKADQDSQTMKRLQAAGNAVKRASDSLVKAAQKAAFDAQDEQAVVVKSKMVGGIAQIIAAQEEMLRKERELDEARKKLATIRQQQYKFLPSELREDGQEQ